MTGSCDEAAEAVAVVAASWAARYRTSGTSLPPVATAVAPGPVQPFPPPPPAPAAAAPALAQATAPASRGLDVAWLVGAGTGVMAAPRGTAASFVAVEVEAAARRLPWNARFLALAANTRTVAFDPGQASWRRVLAGAGIARAWRGSAAFATLGLDALAGASFLEGQGFTSNARTTSLELGGALGGRLGWRPAGSPLAPWLGARALGWGRRQRLRVEGISSDNALPPLDVMFEVGLSWDPAHTPAPALH